MFTDKIELIISNGVETIGEKDLIPKGIGTVSWSWNDDEGQVHTIKLNNVIYFPESPVNIISATALAESMKDDLGIWVPTKGKYSIFTWVYGKYKNTIARTENCLPELEIQAGFSKFSIFCKIVVSNSRYSIFSFASI